MFDNLSGRLSAALRGLSGKARLTEENVGAALRDVRTALLDADVALPVVRAFTENVKQRALGQAVAAGLAPREAMINVVHEELVQVMGEANDALNLAAPPPVVILMAGLQGAGKTTTAAKLALFVKQRLKKRAALVSADVYRPAAIRQLEVLAAEAGAQFIPSSTDEAPLAIAQRAVAEAQRKLADVLVVDTAGRLAIDDAMMQEIKSLQDSVQPVETLFVVDAMTGQDAAATAKAFNEVLDLTGVILAKADGDARGGAALSVRFLTGKPIKFLGMGEKLEALDPFHPDRLASRILGMGDVLSLIEDAERKVDRRRAERLAKKVTRRQHFDLADFRDQMQSMASMGGVGGMLDKLPGMNQLPPAARSRLDDSQFRQASVIIDSMTLHERRFPDLINPSRKRRIALGSGTAVTDVNRVLKQHRQMQKMMKKLGRKGAARNLMRGMQGMQRGRPRPARR